MSLQSTLKGAQSFIFGGNTGLTYEQMKRQRAMAQLMAQRVATGSPQNAGQGLQALTGAFVSRKMGDRADAAATEGREKAQSALGALLQGRLGGGAMPGPATSFLPPQRGEYGITPGAAPGAAAFPASLIQSESGGNWGALNNEGYGGRLQFGKDRLADAARAGVIPAGVTGAEFSKLPPEVQQRVENWHFADIDQQAQRMGLDQYIGQQVAGIPITQDGIRAMAHLGGIGGAAKFLQSGGRHNPADSNGTSLADYARKHGGAPPAMALAEGPQPDLSFVSQMGGGIDPQLLAVMADPYVSELPEMQQGALAAMFQQQLAQAYPEQMTPYQQAQLGLQREQLGWEREKAMMPDPVKPTDDMREYEFARGQGYQGSFQDFMLENRRAGATNVTVGGEGAPGLGKLSTDYGYVLDPETGRPVIDPQTGLPRSAPIPGSPAARELADADAKRETRTTQAGNSAAVVLQDIDKAASQVSGWTAGMGSRLAAIPGTDARDLQASLDTVRANIGFDRLQQMREASPTGGALGGIAIQELQMLQAVLGSLDTAQSPEQLRSNLERLKKIYEPIARKAAAYPNAAEFGFGGAMPETSPSSSGPPAGIDAALWEHMTPEEKALWQ